MGTTGESPTLTHDEHERVIAIVVETAAGRAKVVAGTGSNSTAEAIRLTRFAARAGVDGSLQVAPYYNRPSQEGLYRHFAAIAECTDLPLVLYNVPSRTGRNIEPETIERLAAIGPIVAVKEAAGSLDQVSELLARTNLTILSGDDSLTLPMLAVGAEGVVSVVANLVPRDVIDLIDAVRRAAVSWKLATPTCGSSRCAVICWRSGPTRYRSKPLSPSWAGATEKCASRSAPSTNEDGRVAREKPEELRPIDSAYVRGNINNESHTLCFSSLLIIVIAYSGKISPRSSSKSRLDCRACAT